MPFYTSNSSAPATEGIAGETNPPITARPPASPNSNYCALQSAGIGALRSFAKLLGRRITFVDSEPRCTHMREKCGLETDGVQASFVKVHFWESL
jgi:hypothetical protein